jgi:putative transposase
MPRRARKAIGGMIYHVMNRGCGRMKLFTRSGDYEAFVKLLGESHARFPSVRILSYCIMPNHWHLVLWPTEDGELSRFMFWLTMTHVQRWRHSRQLVGLGPLYQGRFKAFPVEADAHLFIILRYVERNAIRAKLVRRAEDWQWCSLHLRLNNSETSGKLLHAWPIDEPIDWLNWVNHPQTQREIDEVRVHIRRGIPFGDTAWQARSAKLHGIELHPRPRGRPSGKRK